MENKNESYESIMKQAASKKTGIFDLSKTYPAYIILFVFLLASAGVWKLSVDKVDSERRAEYDKAVSSILSRMDAQVQRHNQIMQSMKGLYYQNVEVVRDYFELYGTAPAKNYTSILGMSYAPKVLGKDWAAFHFNARSQGYYEYKLKPEGERDLYYPILHSVLYSKNAHRIGFDYATDPIALAAINLAKDSNKTVATEFYQLRKDTLGFAFVTPIYNKEAKVEIPANRGAAFIGSLILEVDANIFFRKALLTENDESYATDTTLIFKFEDSGVKQSNTVYSSNNVDMLKSGFTPYIKETYDIKIANRILKVTFMTIPDFGGGFLKIFPYLALISMLVLSFIFFGFVLSVMTGRARALDLADRMTRSQRRILETSNDIIGVLDLNLIWKSVNPAVMGILGKQVAEVEGANMSELLFEESDLAILKNIIDSCEDEKTGRADFRLKKSDGEMRWVAWSFTVSKSDGLVYCIGRDVTIEKLAEKEALIKRNQIDLAGKYAVEASQSKTNFMIKLSHQLRNSLTSIVGYLQLLTNKIYDSEEEHDDYLHYAEQGSEEIFTFVSDIVDATINSGDSSLDNYVNVKMKDAASQSLEAFKKKTDGVILNLKMDEECMSSGFIANPKLFNEAMTHILLALTAGMKNPSVEIFAQENKYEGATEIQILGPGNELAARLITLYKDNSGQNNIEKLKDDSENILLNIAKATSNFRMMNGSMTVDTFGGTEGNVVQITMPLVKSILE